MDMHTLMIAQEVEVLKMNSKAVKGYAIVAMRREGLNNAQIERIIDEMNSAIDEKSGQEAEQEYVKFCMEM